MMLNNHYLRAFCVVVISLCAGLGALAQERATVILQDGERLTGTVLSTGSDARNRNSRGRSELVITTDDGRELQIPMEQLAVIQFGSGGPTAAELDNLPQDRSQVIIRRNGTREVGQFIGLAGGDLLRWQSRNGREQMISFRDLTRIYLNTDRARFAFEDGGRASSSFRGGRDQRQSNRNDSAAGGRDDRDFRARGDDRRGGNDSRRVRGGSGEVQNADVRVEANQAWTSTGMTVRAGDLVTFRASGQINFGRGETQHAGPEGNPSLKFDEYPVSRGPVGALIGRVGNGIPFLIGVNGQPMTMPASGMLMLGVNDNEIGDNSGVFTVAVARQ